MPGSCISVYIGVYMRILAGLAGGLGSSLTWDPRRCKGLGFRVIHYIGQSS